MVARDRLNDVHTSPATAPAENPLPCARAGRISVALAFVLGAVLAGGVTLRMTSAADEPQKKQSPKRGYAEVYLNLAEAQLAYAEQMNRQASGTFSDEQLKSYRQLVVIGQELLKQEMQSGKFDRMTALVHWAQYRLVQAQAEVSIAEELNRQVPGSISDKRLKELRAYADLMRLDAEKGQNVQHGPAEEQILWRLTALEDEMLRLRKEVGVIGAAQQ